MSLSYYKEQAAGGGEASTGGADLTPRRPRSLQSSDRYSASTVRDNDATTERSHLSPLNSPSPPGFDIQITPDQLGATLQHFSLSGPLPSRLDGSDFEPDKSDLEGPDDGDFQIHRDAIRGNRLSLSIPSGPKREASVISDLGNKEYDTRNQITSDAESSEDDADSGSDSLQEKLMDDLVRHPNTGNKCFIPRGHFDRVMNEQAVRLELERCKELRSRLSGLSSEARDQTIRDYVDQIFGKPGQYDKTRQNGKYKQIFGILVLIEKVDCIVDFLDQEVDDTQLPFRREQLPSKRKRTRSTTKLYPRRGGSSIRLFKEWQPARRDMFEEWQWVIVAAFFFRGNGGEAKIFNLQDNATPPFVRDTGSGRKEFEKYEGGFGTVTKRYIHADHHDLKPDKNSAFAIKKINSRKYEDFKAEFDMLAKLGKTSHPHLVSLLGAYCHRKSNYLIFDWADSDLSKFWREHNPKPEFNHETVLWVIAQCAGLASGLHQIHRYGSILEANNPGSDRDLKLYGRHGDIKPENVLWFQKENGGGTLKICDFGVAEFHTKKSRSNRSNNHIATSPFYRPPESELKNGLISRSYDIWSMGCLYLEFLGWLLGGWNMVRQMSIERERRSTCGYGSIMDDNPYYEIDELQTTATIKPQVTRFIEKAHANPKCSQLVHDLLDVILTGLLVVETKDEKSRRRIESGRLHALLREMHDRCKQDIAYAIKPCPRK
ncbi:hypothetical protein CEP52_009854 [Fusarium oligoseptatum]|uniref:Protein kinase domain-containing protein n=1 Tax=Fusarium oligoseptatum TaxID=2604345 RepID=A0A428TB64_9HYPO|nr:hypothetical protein CEP52_009854 [Fusarium oligoseptatum]